MPITGIQPFAPQFGAKPPKLFTRVTEDQLRPDGMPYMEGDKWVNPDGEYTDKEIREMLAEPGGASRLFEQLGLRDLYKRMGGKALLSEMRMRRIVKESLKRVGRDKMTDPTPRVVDGYWVNQHDQWHMDLGHGRVPFGPFNVKGNKANGVNGIGGDLVPHFHEGDESYKGKYDGMLDEFLVATYAYTRNPNWLNRMRVGMYLAKLTPKHGLELVREFNRVVKQERQQVIGLQPGMG